MYVCVHVQSSLDSGCVCGSSAASPPTPGRALSAKVHPRKGRGQVVMVMLYVFRHVKVLCDVVLMIVDKFADKIVAWQGKGQSCKLGVWS